MGWERLYTYAEAPVKTVRIPQDPFMAAGYVAGLPEVQAVVKTVAGIGAEVAKAVLAAHPSDQKRTSNPEIRLVRGDRTDYHIEMIVHAQDSTGFGEPDIAAALSIEFGREGYFDSRGRWQKPTEGVGALQAAMNVMALL